MKTLLIRSCLLAGVACAVSCSSLIGQKTPQENPEQRPAPASTPIQPEPVVPPASSPLPVRPDLPQQQTGGPSAPAMLPGDVRPGLRTPSLPDTLLFDPSGKLTVPSAS